MAFDQRRELLEKDDATAGLDILSLAVLERTGLSTDPKKPQWRGKPNDISQKNGKQAISHRHIEKRRRDRINNTLWMLKDLVPAAKLKYASGSGRLEKADLLEMTVQHLNHVHRSLAKVAETQGGNSPAGCSTALNEVYCNGFKDGVVHILNELKKLNLLTPSQTEKLLKEELSNDEAMTFQKEFDFLGHGEESSESPLLQRNVDFNQNEEENANTTGNKNNVTTDTTTVIENGNQTCPAQIKSEEILSSVNLSNFISNDTHEERIPIKENIKTELPSMPCSQGEGSPFKNTFLPTTGGCNYPILIPAYALHATGTHYVPVLLPPSSVLPSNSN